VVKQDKHQGLSRRDFIKTVGIGIGAAQTVALGLGTLELTGCGGSPSNPVSPLPVSWPIANQVYTTAQQQVLPIAVSPSAPQLHPGDPESTYTT
jgi:hypothetical protein